MTARVYTPDDTGRCTVCARPEAEHSRSSGWEGDEARCMPDAVPTNALRAMSLCRVCELPMVDHGADGACPTTMLGHPIAVPVPEEVTADNLTRQQIRDHYSKFPDALQRDADTAIAFGGRARREMARIAAFINNANLTFVCGECRERGKPSAYGRNGKALCMRCAESHLAP